MDAAEDVDDCAGVDDLGRLVVVRIGNPEVVEGSGSLGLNVGDAVVDKLAVEVDNLGAVVGRKNLGPEDVVFTTTGSSVSVVASEGSLASTPMAEGVELLALGLFVPLSGSGRNEGAAKIGLMVDGTFCVSVGLSVRIKG